MHELIAMFFSGTSGPTRKVDLRGKSRGEETREQVLERTRLEREKRKRAKVEASSATVIQAKWRQHCAARKAIGAVRSAWADSYTSVAVHPGYENVPCGACAVFSCIESPLDAWLLLLQASVFQCSSNGRKLLARTVVFL